MRGGVADFTALLSQELARLGHEVAVLTGTSVGVRRDGDVRVAGMVPGWGVGVIGAFERHVREFRPDVVNVQYQTGAFGMKIGVNLLPWLTRPLAHRPASIVTFHDLKEPYLLPKLGRARHLATIALAAGSDAVIVTNHEDFSRVAHARAKDRTRAIWGGRSLAAIPIGSNVPSAPLDVDRAATRQTVGLEVNDFVIAFFGFIVPTKGVESLAAALELLRQRGRPARLVMVGAARGDSETGASDYEAEVRRLLTAEPLREAVRWTGYLEPNAVARVLSAADVVALPYRQGGSLRHGTLLAALAQGLPIVTTESPVAPLAPLPTLIVGENALLVPPDNAAALAAALERLAADPALRARLAAGARRLRDQTSWRDIARQTLDLYQRAREGVL